MTEKKYEPLSEAAINLTEHWAVIDREKRWVNSDVIRLIATIRDLQGQLEGAQGAVDQLLNVNEGLKHERDRYMDILKRVSTPTADEIRAQVQAMKKAVEDGTAAEYDVILGEDLKEG